MKNIYRIIIWGLVFVLCLTAGTYGLYTNYKVLKDKKELINYMVEKFNDSEYLNNFKSNNVIINAKNKGTNIIVTYESYTIIKYTFNIKENHIETSYQKSDSFGKVMVMLMADAVSQYYGTEKGNIYPLFNNNDELYTYTLDKGIIYEEADNTYTVKLNLNKPIKYNTLDDFEQGDDYNENAE